MQKTVKAITWPKCRGRAPLSEELLQNFEEKWRVTFRMGIFCSLNCSGGAQYLLEHKIFISAIAMLQDRHCSPETMNHTSSS